MTSGLNIMRFQPLWNKQYTHNISIMADKQSRVISKSYKKEQVDWLSDSCCKPSPLDIMLNVLGIDPNIYLQGVVFAYCRVKEK